jgi:hypothetical protein
MAQERIPPAGDYASHGAGHTWPSWQAPHTELSEIKHALVGAHCTSSRTLV